MVCFRCPLMSIHRTVGAESTAENFRRVLTLSGGSQKDHPERRPRQRVPVHLSLPVGEASMRPRPSPTGSL